MAVFDDMIADILSNKNLNPMVTNYCFYHIILFCHSKKYSIHYFFMKTPNKSELQQIAFNHSSDIGFQDFMNLYKKCTAKPYSFLVIDITLALDNSSRFRKDLLGRI